MQGLKDFIPTDVKIRYINKLLEVGFDTLDFGSFVSPKVIPQMKDTAEVVVSLDLRNTRSKLLAIVANERGAEDACRFPQIKFLGFPLSVSETFQIRNTNKSIKDAFTEVGKINELCSKNNKDLVIYISMGFGNPYGDPYDENIIAEFIDRLRDTGIKIISLSDTIGVSQPAQISGLFSSLTQKDSSIEIGVHLHSTPGKTLEKIEAAFTSGCKRFDGAIRGFGGCPMAKDDLVGNMATEKIINFLEENGVSTGLDMKKFEEAFLMSSSVFLH